MRTDCKTAKYSGKAPSIKMGSSLEGYVPLKYICEFYRDGELEFSDSNYTLKVMPEITYSTSVLPQTNHPFLYRKVAEKPSFSRFSILSYAYYKLRLLCFLIV